MSKGNHPKSEFKKGHIPWHKGKTGVYSNDSLQKMGVNKGKKFPNRKMPPRTKEHQEKLSKAIAGELNWNWKGGINSVIARRSRIQNAEGSHTLGEWELLKKQYGFTCLACGKSEPEIKLTEDHIIPLIKGGSNFIENIQPLCGKCNSRKNIKIIKYGI